MNDGPQSRIRLKFARLKEASSLTHLEQIKAFRAVAMACGLKCRPAKAGRTAVPKMSFGPAISVGYESTCEYADLYLDEFVKAETAKEKVAALDNCRFKLLEASRIPMFFPSIEAGVNAVEYLLEGGLPDGFSQGTVDRFLGLKSAVYEKVKPSGEKKSVDARPLVLEAACGPQLGALKLVLALGPGRNIKPEAVFGLIAGGPAVPERIVRKELFWFDSKGGLEVF
ncbi:MAG TPA: hypothetical protein DCL44_11950 [Elusimicrobia bacterium]|nr:hypothetical protein [Elusimicrobiota bacterium]